MAYGDYEKRAAELMREWGVTCDCGWDTGDHAPECAVEVQWANAMDTARDEAYAALEGEESSTESVVDDCDPGDMDGDLASGLASCGWGVDEDYGCGMIDDGGW